MRLSADLDSLPRLRFGHVASLTCTSSHHKMVPRVKLMPATSPLTSRAVPQTKPRPEHFTFSNAKQADVCIPFSTSEIGLETDLSGRRLILELLLQGWNRYRRLGSR